MKRTPYMRPSFPFRHEMTLKAIETTRVEARVQYLNDQKRRVATQRAPANHGLPGKCQEVGWERLVNSTSVQQDRNDSRRGQ